MTTPHWLQTLQNQSQVNQNVDYLSRINSEIIERYRVILSEFIPSGYVQEVVQIEGDETNPIHLLWMLSQIENNPTMSITKRHRWLGYIQGVLITKGVLTVANERNEI